MQTLNELEKATLQWSYDRGILTNGKATTQALKLMSEAGELAGNLNEDKDIKDDIGDCLVVLTNLANLTKTSLDACGLHQLGFRDSSGETYLERATVLDLFTNLGKLCDNVAKGLDIKVDIKLVLVNLQELCNFYELSIVECWNLAYEDIKDRKGFLNEQGNFIKSTDKNYQQLLLEFEGTQK